VFIGVDVVGLDVDVFVDFEQPIRDEMTPITRAIIARDGMDDLRIPLFYRNKG